MKILKYNLIIKTLSEMRQQQWIVLNRTNSLMRGNSLLFCGFKKKCLWHVDERLKRFV